jgi:hypothetical protein
MSLFDLQTVTFWQLKNAPRIADFETFKKSDPASPPSVIGYTYELSEQRNQPSSRLRMEICTKSRGQSFRSGCLFQLGIRFFPDKPALFRQR